jgi:Ca-activated chloride channel family protein
MLPIAIGVLLLTAPSPQSLTSPGRPPALLVRMAEEGPSQPLSIEKMDVQVSATAFLAETTTTIVFRNDNARALEGELVFPLPEGATLSGYALDVEGVLVDGVVVEQQKARIVFEQEVRKGIDPGLAEWVKGSNFRTRIWPVPARGTRTVRVRYLSALSVRGSDTGLEATYVLPMVRQKISLFSLRIEVAKTQVTPEIRSGDLATLHFDRWEERYVAETRLADFEAREDLTVALPAVPRQNVTVERGADGGAYFTLDAFPVGAQVATEARPAKKAGLYWDASMSRDSADRRAEMRAIELWLRRVGNIELEVVVFRNVTDPPRAFSIRGGNAIALLAFLEAAPRDGGTDLGSLVFNSDPDYDVVVTDGVDNLTNRLPESKRPLYILNGDARADHAALRHLARLSGGTYFNLQNSSGRRSCPRHRLGVRAPSLDRSRPEADR